MEFSKMIRSFITTCLFSGAVLATAAEKVKVFVSILPQKYVVEQIAGDTVSVQSLLSEDDNPHSFVVSPGVIRSLGKADAYFQIGIPFEDVILAKIKDSGFKLKFHRHDSGIKRRHVKTEHRCSSGCVHHVKESDPHFWISAGNIIEMAENSAVFLAELRPKQKDEFKKNLDEFKQKLQALNGQLKKDLAPHKGKAFYVYHPAFGYFADAYGLTQKAVEVEGKKPSPRQLTQLISQAKKDGIKTIIVQNQFDRRAAERVAKVVGGNVVEVNPMSEDVLKLLQLLGDAIKKGFGN